MFNTEFIIADIMQKHINTAKIVGGYVDFLTEKSIADILFAKNFCKLQKQRAAAHRRINGTALTPDKDGNYTVEVLTDTRITVEGVAKESALAAPTVDTHGYDGAWTADNVTLTPSATADSGIAYYEYSKDDGKSWTSLTGNSLTISESDFAKDYIFWAVSNAGNVSPESDPVTVQIDKAKPGVTFDGNTTDYLQEDTLKIPHHWTFRYLPGGAEERQRRVDNAQSIRR